MVHWFISVISKLQAFLKMRWSAKCNATPWEILGTIRLISSRDQQMPINVNLIVRETGVSKTEVRRHLKRLSNSDFIFFEGSDVLLSYAGRYYNSSQFILLQ